MAIRIDIATMKDVKAKAPEPKPREVRARMFAMTIYRLPTQEPPAHAAPPFTTVNPPTAFTWASDLR